MYERERERERERESVLKGEREGKRNVMQSKNKLHKNMKKLSFLFKNITCLLS